MTRKKRSRSFSGPAEDLKSSASLSGSGSKKADTIKASDDHAPVKDKERPVSDVKSPIVRRVRNLRSRGSVERLDVNFDAKNSCRYEQSRKRPKGEEYSSEVAGATSVKQEKNVVKVVRRKHNTRSGDSSIKQGGVETLQPAAQQNVPNNSAAGVAYDGKNGVDEVTPSESLPVPVASTCEAAVINSESRHGEPINCDISKEEKKVEKVEENCKKVDVTQDATTDDEINMRDFYPEKVLALREALQLSYAALFREAQMFGGSMNSGYLWLRREHLHRNGIKEAGKLLARWYKASISRAPAGFKEAGRDWTSPFKDVFKAPRPSAVAKGAVTPLAGCSFSSSPNPFVVEGVRRNKSLRLHEVFLKLSSDVEPRVIAQYLTKEDATNAAKKAKGFIKEKTEDLIRSYRLSAYDRKPNAECFCASCGKQDGIKMLGCTVCTKNYHPKCLIESLSEEKWKTLSPVPTVAPADEDFKVTCTKCLSSISAFVRESLGLPAKLDSELSSLRPRHGRAVGAASSASSVGDKEAELRTTSATPGSPKRLHLERGDGGSLLSPFSGHANGNPLNNKRRASHPRRWIASAGQSGRSGVKNTTSFDSSSPAGYAGSSLQFLLSKHPTGRVETHGPQFAFSFPVSKSFIKYAPSTKASKVKSNTRQIDDTDYYSNSRWLSKGLVDGLLKSRNRVYYREFCFLDNPDVVYRILDHVLLFRISPGGEEEEIGDSEAEEEAGTGKRSPSSSAHTERQRSRSLSEVDIETNVKLEKPPPDFYVGQIEALWEEPDGSRKARVAWLFWPSETRLECIGIVEPNEVFTSHEVDVVNLSSIAAKAQVLSYSEYLKTLSKCKKRERELNSKLSSVETPLRSSSGFDDSSHESDHLSESQRKLANGLRITKAGLGDDQAAFGEDFDEGYSVSSRRDVEIGVLLKKKHAKKLLIAPKILFSRRHFHFGTNQLLGGNNQSEAETGANSLMYSYLHATFDKPDTIACLTSEERQKVEAAMLKSDEASSTTPRKSSHLNFSTILNTAPSCAFCFEDLPFVGHIECAVCPQTVICFHCFALGRQGVVTPKPQSLQEGYEKGDPRFSLSADGHERSRGISTQVKNGSVVRRSSQCKGSKKAESHAAKRQTAATESPTQNDSTRSVQFLHRCSHPYRVSAPKLECLDSQLAIDILCWMCRNYGLKPPVFLLASVMRTPLSASGSHFTGVRFRYAVCLEPATHLHRPKSTRPYIFPVVLGSQYRTSVTDAKGIAAIDVLSAVFGISNKDNVLLLSTEWKAGEALRLIDALGVHSLAWEPAADTVETKSAPECAQFFSCYLHPAWAAQSEWANSLRLLQSDSKSLTDKKKFYVSNVPPPTSDTVNKAIKEAIEWGSKVHSMAVRRSNISRREKRGLAFAVVDGRTVFAARPDHFGSRITKSTEAILESDLDLENASVDAQKLQAISTVVHAPVSDVSTCVLCNRVETFNNMVSCDGCDGMYHLDCVTPPLKTIPRSDWFCSDCNADREYLYDHCSYGPAGGTLVKLLKGVGVWPLADPLWEKRVREWEDNEIVLRRASRKAIKMDFGAPSCGESPSAAEGLDSEAVRKASPRKRAKGPKRSREALDDLSSDIDEEDDCLRLSKEEISSMISWASRHHASQLVATLEASNRGLSEALAHTMAQRDTLLEVVRTRRS